jgi:hypothetical protein
MPCSNTASFFNQAKANRQSKNKIVVEHTDKCHRSPAPNSTGRFLKSSFIKYPYTALEFNNSDYDNYIVFKSHCTHSKKAGVVRKGELIKIASKSSINSKTFYRHFSKFKKIGWIIPCAEGHRLLSINTINNNLSLKSKTHKDGYVHYPFFKVSTNNIKNLEEIKMYHLILQSSIRYNYHLPANTIPDNSTKMLKKKKQKENEFKIGLEKIASKGAYKSKTEVDKIIDKAIDLGLIKRTKNGINATGKYNCNGYTFNLYDYSQPLSIKPKVLKPLSLLKKKMKKTKTVYNTSELKFKDFIDTYLIDLIENGFIDKRYYARKVSKRSYNKVLKKILLSKSELKTILLGYVDYTDIQIKSNLIESNWFTCGYVQSLPKEYTDKEYGIDYRFHLTESTTTEGQLNQVLYSIRLAKNNHYDNHHTKQKTTVNKLEQSLSSSLNDFRQQLRAYNWN